MAMDVQISAIIPLVLWSGFFTMCIVQVIKPLTRLWIHEKQLDRWLLQLPTDKATGANASTSGFAPALLGTVPRSIAVMPSEQFCGYIAQRLSHELESGPTPAIPSEAASTTGKPTRELQALRKVDELLARIKRSLELAIQVEVFLVSIIVFGILYRNLGVSLTVVMQAIALLVAAYSATILRDLVAIIEKLKR
jgi:hypothetical protein